jgi:hypothetical protein
MGRKSVCIAGAITLYFTVYQFFGYKFIDYYLDSFDWKYDGNLPNSVETATLDYPFSIEPDGIAMQTQTFDQRYRGEEPPQLFANSTGSLDPGLKWLPEMFGYSD